MKKLASIFAVLVLAGCTQPVTPDQKAQLQVTGQAFAMSLAGVAAANSTTVSDQVTKGALFCQKVQAGAPLVVALANIYGAPVTVLNQTGDAVKDACALIGGVPVAPPVDPTVVPVQGSATTLPAISMPTVSVIIPTGGSISARSDMKDGCVIADHFISGCVLTDGAHVALK